MINLRGEGVIIILIGVIVSCIFNYDYRFEDERRHLNLVAKAFGLTQEQLDELM